MRIAVACLALLAFAATSFALAQDPTRTHHVRSAMPIQYVAVRSDHQEEQPFLSENDAVMKRMMVDMMMVMPVMVMMHDDHLRLSGRNSGESQQTAEGGE